MLIRKILNNNVIITYDVNGREIVVMGKGIAYGKKNGDCIDTQKVTKKFILSSMEYPDRLIDALSSISPDCIELCDDIIQYAKHKLSSELDDSLYISLLDHISTSIERYKNGVKLKNKLLWEIKQFYKNEYEIGQYGIAMIKEKYGLTLLDDEAGFIALHIISAELSNDIQDIYEITEFIQSIVNITKYYFMCNFDTDTLQYFQFITLLKFLGHRIFSKDFKPPTLIKNNLLDIIEINYTEPYLCSIKIKEFIGQKYNYQLDDDEFLYITIYIANLPKI